MAAQTQTQTTNAPARSKKATLRTPKAEVQVQQAVSVEAPQAEKQKAAARVRKSAPHFHKAAVCAEKRRVENARVIKVETGLYRGTVISGTFELAPDTTPHTHAQVIAKWFGWSPNRGTIRIGLFDAKVIEKYTGEVTANFGVAS